MQYVQTLKMCKKCTKLTHDVSMVPLVLNPKVKNSKSLNYKAHKLLTFGMAVIVHFLVSRIVGGTKD